MKLGLVSVFVLSAASLIGCKTNSASSEKSWADVDATKPAVQLPNGQYLVFCQAGTQEPHPWADLVSGNICNTTTEARRCECVDSNGPDLMQIGFNADSGAVLWKTKIGGWNATAANWDICYSQLRSFAPRPRVKVPIIRTRTIRRAAATKTTAPTSITMAGRRQEILRLSSRRK